MAQPSRSHAQQFFLLVLFSLTFFLSGCAALTGQAQNVTLAPQLTSEWSDLFNGQDFTGWYSYLPSAGINSDSKGVFKVENGMLHVLDIPVTGANQEFGYLATENAYSNYHLRFEYQWGSKKFAPRDNSPRDAGVLYHMRGKDQIWPRSVEVQAMENNTGDLWLIGGNRATTTVNSLSDSIKTYKPGGATFTNDARSYFRVRRSANKEQSGWNTVDLKVYGQQMLYMVNGVVVHKAWNMKDASGNALNSGRILFQAEGAEVYYRNIKIRAITSLGDSPPTDPTEPTTPTERIVLFDGSSTDAFVPRTASGQMWPIVGGALEVLPGGAVGANDLQTVQSFQDFKLHVEFKVPKTPAGTPEQGRGNSGIYLQGRYEVQILDSYQRALSGANDCAALYGVANASKNRSKPAGSWQGYTIYFKAPRFSANGTKLSPAKVTVYWNGALVHNARAVYKPTTLGDPEGTTGVGPIRLQDHRHKVQYRNIWIEPL